MNRRSFIGSLLVTARLPFIATAAPPLALKRYRNLDALRERVFSPLGWTSVLHTDNGVIVGTDLIRLHCSRLYASLVFDGIEMKESLTVRGYSIYNCGLLIETVPYENAIVACSGDFVHNTLNLRLK